MAGNDPPVATKVTLDEPCRVVADVGDPTPETPYTLTTGGIWCMPRRNHPALSPPAFRDLRM